MFINAEWFAPLSLLDSLGFFTQWLCLIPMQITFHYQKIMQEITWIMKARVVLVVQLL